MTATPTQTQDSTAYSSIHAARRERLAFLAKTLCCNRQSDLAVILDRSPAVVWQYMTGHRNMGENFARHIEKQLALPANWMDATDAQPSQAEALLAQLTPDQRAEAMQMLEAFVASANRSH